MFNRLFRHNIDKIHTRTICELQKQLSKLVRNDNDRVILMVDFNIGKTRNVNTYNKLINNMNIIDSSKGIIPTYHQLGHSTDQYDQIDYIFTNSTDASQAMPLLDERYINISDHYPLMVEL